MFNVLSSDAECDMFVEEFMYLSVEAKRALTAGRNGRARRLSRRADLLLAEAERNGREFAQRFRARLAIFKLQGHSAL